MQLSETGQTKEKLTLTELCRELSISPATGRNWIRTGKLVPAAGSGKTPVFAKQDVERLKEELTDGTNAALKSRRNKKHISGNRFLPSYVNGNSKNLVTVQAVVDWLKERQITITDELLWAAAAEAALQLIRSKDGREMEGDCLRKYLTGDVDAGKLGFLIDDLIHGNARVKEVIDAYPELFRFSYVYEEREDVLGLLYLSMRSTGRKKSTGSYYTPAKLAKKLCQSLFFMNPPGQKDVFDPCCGTGSFLLQLPKEIDSDHVYGNDVDPLSVRIARINYALKYGITDAEKICTHITECDYLAFDREKKFDYIIGNPPWGCSFCEEQKRRLKENYTSAQGAGVESYDVFIEQAIRNLKEGGVLSFILPEAVLTTGSHQAIRGIMLASCSFQYAEFLGEAFEGVQCPCVILQMTVKGENGESTASDCVVKEKKREYIISRSRKLDAEHLSLFCTDEEHRIMKKIEENRSHVRLLGHAVFAMGIVTGNNREHVSSVKTQENEVVLRGADLHKFRITPSDHFLQFCPERFQQTAPVECYRAKEKLVYRFICNQLVFAFDDSQRLTLNSANIVIPQIEDLDMKYIMAVLNSRAAQFYFSRKFHSLKILRSQIEQIPIPKTDRVVQEKIIGFVNQIVGASAEETRREVFELLEQEIRVLYELDDPEYQIITEALEGENLFLN
ncbi:MAG: N-6 DNA methylase [Lachnospiraceae bacterium]|nr:N-6 DNA methylase [Lachnospiraceae bacterium]